MIELPNVTLCCVDTKHHRLAVRSLCRSMRDIRFARVAFLTDAVPPDVWVPDAIEVRPIATLASHDAYSEFMLKGLLEHIDTEFALVTQWDGYVVHADAWDPVFLTYDYIGAKWPQAEEPFNVGNGGFSLRSRKLLLALQDERVKPTANEDQVICGDECRALLETDYGTRFATSQLADRFSFEMDPSELPTFGFHGLFNFFLVESETDLVDLASQLSDDVANSTFCMFLLRNCASANQWQATRALGERILRSDPQNTETFEIVGKAHAILRAGTRAQPTAISKAAFRLLQRITGSQ